jgi:hypothetical protein
MRFRGSGARPASDAVPDRVLGLTIALGIAAAGRRAPVAPAPAAPKRREPALPGRLSRTEQTDARCGQNAMPRLTLPRIAESVPPVTASMSVITPPPLVSSEIRWYSSTPLT